MVGLTLKYRFMNGINQIIKIKQICLSTRSEDVTFDGSGETFPTKSAVCCLYFVQYSVNVLIVNCSYE